MVSKQKSIFDSETNKVKPQIVQSKTIDETVPFEESIFAIKKKEPVVVKAVHEEEYVPIEDTIFYQGSSYREEDDDNSFLSNDDEIPLEESIFAKPKKIVSSPVVIKSKENINLNDLFMKYKDIYMNECICNKQRLNMIDSNTFNVCCVNLESSLKIKVMNIEAYDVMKKLIKSSCKCAEEAFYCYTNLNKCLIDLAHELNPNENVSVIFHMIDRSYAEVINELGGVRWQK